MLFINLPMDRGCFYFLAILNNAAMNTVCKYLKTLLLFCWVYT